MANGGAASVPARKDLVTVSANNFFRRKTEQLFGRPIPEHKPEMPIQHSHAIGCASEKIKNVHSPHRRNISMI
jgi:hypothetical protein